MVSIPGDVAANLLADEMWEKIDESDIFFKNNPIPIYIWRCTNDDYLLIKYNIAAERITGNQIVHYLGRRASEMYADTPEILNDFITCQRNKDSSSREMPYKFMSTGEERILLVTYTYAPPDFILVHLMDITEHKTSEKELSKYKTISDHANYGVAIITLEGEVIYSNDYYAHIHGYQSEEILGKNVSIFHTAEQMIHVNKMRRKARHGKGFQAQEIWHRHKNGSVFPMLMSGFPIHEDERPKYLAATAIEIKKKVHVQEILQKSRQTAMSLLDASLDSALLIERKGKIEALNEAAAMDFDHKNPRELIGKNYFKLLPSDTMKQRKMQMKKFFQTRKPVRFEEFNNGRWFDINFYPIFNTAGDIEKLAIFSRDISEEKRMKDALQATTESYRFLYEEMPSMYFTVDERGIVLSVNQFGAEQLGYTVDELLGRSVFDVFHADDKPSVLKQINKCFDIIGKIDTWELRKVRKDGSILWVRETARAVKRADGSRIIIIVCEDITPIKEAQAEKEKLYQKITVIEKQATIGQFTSAIAHEINNPLHIILGKLYLLEKNLSGFHEDSKWIDSVRRIREQVDRISHLVKNVLEYSQPHALLFDSVNVNMLVKHLITNLFDMDTKSPKYEFDLNPEIPDIMGDGIQLELALKNILMNAIESSVGPLTIRIQTDIRPENMIAITITDNGKGISSAEMARIFEPFFTTKRDTGGSGLGLSISKYMIDKHRGRISVKSEVKKGSSFTIYLPIRRE